MNRTVQPYWAWHQSNLGAHFNHTGPQWIRLEQTQWWQNPNLHFTSFSKLLFELVCLSWFGQFHVQSFVVSAKAAGTVPSTPSKVAPYRNPDLFIDLSTNGCAHNLLYPTKITIVYKNVSLKFSHSSHITCNYFFFFNKALLIFATKAESPLHMLCVQSLGDLCWLHATPTDVCNLEAEQEHRAKVVRGALKLSFRFSAQGVSRC